MSLREVRIQSMSPVGVFESLLVCIVRRIDVIQIQKRMSVREPDICGAVGMHQRPRPDAREPQGRTRRERDGERRARIAETEAHRRRPYTMSAGRDTAAAVYFRRVPVFLVAWR